ncbi:hypothetical protein ACPV3S_12940 [Photobacterium damselae]|uniref:hypothetical protein n=1 Tax=Photobacterium damselae TaxID=38293 RepID=UPI00406901EA
MLKLIFKIPGAEILTLLPAIMFVQATPTKNTLMGLFFLLALATSISLVIAIHFSFTLNSEELELLSIKMDNYLDHMLKLTFIFVFLITVCWGFYSAVKPEWLGWVSQERTRYALVGIWISYALWGCYKHLFKTPTYLTIE